ncbi:polymorphic toxin-type HINT domain-containing protein [Nonomuraea sp. MTCD27]|uniref:polymorphic toxin-type HINT domain-containing protein n=1 Tax=Nonomuraea sp. MTCD27 TaxID=1676747 RepID=UPI0035BEC84A
MADGTHKAIDRLKAGDQVVATDPASGRTAAKPVLKTITSKGVKRLVSITVDVDGDRGGRTGTVIATDRHPIWVPEYDRWTDAGELRPGMWLQTSAGTYVQITAIEHEVRQGQRVHNLSIADIHTYYTAAGEADRLVHNTGCAPGHIAEVSVFNSKGVARGAETGEAGPVTFWSGGRTPAEAAQGPWKGGMATHTEARATRAAGAPWPFWKAGDDPLLGRTPAVAGDTYYLEGQLPPCSWCQVAMEEAAAETGTNWVYTWVENGARQFWWRGPGS